jgi:hypothetical protein
MITIGIDPGWASFGIAISKDGNLLGKTSFVPKDFGTRLAFIKELNKWLDTYQEYITSDFVQVFMERFVAYAGVQVSNSESILMLIGAIDYLLSSNGMDVVLIRALDWKVKICHHLVKTQDFNNPYKNFDKKYSILVAETLSGQKFKSDHEADAVCMSYLTKEILCGK